MFNVCKGEFEPFPDSDHIKHLSPLLVFKNTHRKVKIKKN